MSFGSEVSQLVDEHRLGALLDSEPPESSSVGVLLLDADLRIRGVNGTYQTVSMRQRDELLGQFVFDAFPEDPADEQADGCSQLEASLEAAMRRRATDSMPIVRYDIIDPCDPGVFTPKLWSCTNTAVDIGHDQLGVLHRVREITSLDEALSALASSMAGGVMLGAAEQLHVLSALATAAREDRDGVRAMTNENLHLRKALETRDTIGQAKGMLMERYDIDATSAFDLLRTLSQESNTKLADVAAQLIALDRRAD